MSEEKAGSVQNLGASSENPLTEIDVPSIEENIVNNPSFDINSITPGTVFMDNLRKNVCSFLEYKLSTSPEYSNLEIIYSDDRRPGEGEHKILNYIKKMSTNLSHAIYSPDADFLFLGLSLHKYNVRIIREALNFINQFRQKGREFCNIKGHGAPDAA